MNIIATIKEYIAALGSAPACDVGHAVARDTQKAVAELERRMGLETRRDNYLRTEQATIHHEIGVDGDTCLRIVTFNGRTLTLVETFGGYYTALKAALDRVNAP